MSRAKRFRNEGRYAALSAIAGASMAVCLAIFGYALYIDENPLCIALWVLSIGGIMSCIHFGSEAFRLHRLADDEDARKIELFPRL